MKINDIKAGTFYARSTARDPYDYSIRDLIFVLDTSDLITSTEQRKPRQYSGTSSLIKRSSTPQAGKDRRVLALIYRGSHETREMKRALSALKKVDLSAVATVDVFAGDRARGGGIDSDAWEMALVPPRHVVAPWDEYIDEKARRDALKQAEREKAASRREQQRVADDELSARIVNSGVGMTHAWLSDGRITLTREQITAFLDRIDGLQAQLDLQAQADGGAA